MVQSQFLQSLEVKPSRFGLKIVFTDDIRRSAAEYADQITIKESRPGSRDHRNNDRGTHRRTRAYIGKLAEYAVCAVIGGRTDDAIYATGSQETRKFDVDIFGNPQSPLRGLFAHTRNYVKACAWDLRGGRYTSWTIDKHDPRRLAPTEDDVLHLVRVDEAGGFAVCTGWLLAAQVQPLWKASVMLDHKDAIYLEDLESDDPDKRMFNGYDDGFLTLAA